MTVVLGVAVLPAVILMIYIYKMDKREKEPVSKLFLAFLAGILCLVPALVAELFFSGMLDAAFIEPTPYFEPPIMYHIIDNFVVIAFVEELCKFVALHLLSRRNRFYNCFFDGVVYSVFVSLGFATVENIFFSIGSGLYVAIIRMFTAVPGHMCFAVYMGYFYSRMRKGKIDCNDSMASRNLFLALFVSVMLHGIYDLLASIGSTETIIAWLVFVIVMFIMAFRFVKKASNSDRYLVDAMNEPQPPYPGGE